MSLGLFVSINQRLDAGKRSASSPKSSGTPVEFVTAECPGKSSKKKRLPRERPAIPSARGTVMRVTSITVKPRCGLCAQSQRNRREAGVFQPSTSDAYGVQVRRRQTDHLHRYPGHEAFYRMRARGAKVNRRSHHPKSGAVKYQAQEVSAKFRLGMNKLFWKKYWLEAEILDLKANPDRNASGNVIEGTLEQRRGIPCVPCSARNGTLQSGRSVLRRSPFSGRVKAITNEAPAVRVKKRVLPTRWRVLGPPAPPRAGDTFNVMSDEKEAAKSHQTPAIIARTGRRVPARHHARRNRPPDCRSADFPAAQHHHQGDTDGQYHQQRPWVPFSESDVLLLSASDAIRVGLQRTPDGQCQKTGRRKKKIDIRHTPSSTKPCEEIKTAMEVFVTGNRRACYRQRGVPYSIKSPRWEPCRLLCTGRKIMRNNKVRVIPRRYRDPHGRNRRAETFQRRRERSEPPVLRVLV
ncbi:hypothetical protein FQR65_LT20715 [Abscondita terminalis]|nr:hypothetical protein FQR65_LT20715 [Abscondita terminalis]